MEDTKYFNCLEHFLENSSASIVNNTSIRGETSDLNCFTKHLLELGFGLVIKYEGENSKYRFSLERGELPIKFMGCPFFIKQHIYFECVNGPQHKSKNNTDNDHPTCVKKRFSLNSTKKFNCPATMVVIKLLYFPDFTIPESSSINWRSKKQIVSSMLKDFVERTCTTAPSPISREFYPDEKTLRNFIIKFTYKKHQTATFIVPIQCEDSDSITEALYMIKSWNNKWVPQYFVTDYCEAEYNSIAKVFNNCPTYICDFHREQACLRWTNKQGNLHVKDDRGQILTLWRSIAQSNDDTKFTESVEKIKLTDAWLRNPKAQQYFIRTWLSVAKKWTNRFFEDEYDIKISTNNGVETQNKNP
ncbi:hypothetical protein AGLY_018176 [Aphis glycines]|uniref:Uncharacterized protein n=1 Tax=Aphis glycines TaxID=307491 RepID=A0A6G0SSS5_APHGL|nr:hypothetical protein AGLY_018176 [Aphis glycines]